MPFINERLEANRETLARNRADSGPVRVSRFRFEPDAVMASLRANIVGQQHALEAKASASPAPGARPSSRSSA